MKTINIVSPEGSGELDLTQIAFIGKQGVEDKGVKLFQVLYMFASGSFIPESFKEEADRDAKYNVARMVRRRNNIRPDSDSSDGTEPLGLSNAELKYFITPASPQPPTADENSGLSAGAPPEPEGEGFIGTNEETVVPIGEGTEVGGFEPPAASDETVSFTKGEVDEEEADSVTTSIPVLADES